MKNRIGIVPAVLLALALVNGCVQEIETPSLNRVYTVSAGIEDDGTRVSLSQSPTSRDMIARWQDGDEIKILIYGKSDYLELPAVPVSGISADGKDCVFTYSIPDDYEIDDSGYRLVCYTIPPGSDNLTKPKVGKGKATIDLPLLRYPSVHFRAPVLFDGRVVENNVVIAFHHLYTYELLHIYNTSDDPITFSLCGFNTGMSWFRTYARMTVDEQTVYDGGLDVQPVEESSQTTIMPHAEGIVVSAYIPNGQMISDAQIVAKINGEYVNSSNRLSSTVDLKTGYAYHMYAEWNGTELQFLKNDTAPLTVETLTATIDPSSITGHFTGAVTNLSSMAVSRAGFMIWRPEDPEGFVEYDAVVAEDNTFSLTLTYKDFLEMAYDGPVMGTYNVSAYAFKADGSRYSGGILEFTIDREQPDLPTEPTEGDLIDMGLSVTWASCNIGASQPQEVGSFFAWGEVEQKSNYEWSNYELSNGTETSLKKYCLQSTYGIVDNRTKLEPSDDAAYVKSQGKKRMPTAAEWQDLKDKCVWTKIKYKDRDGYLVASPLTGKAIFIPCNGFKTGTNYYNFYAPYYWTADLHLESSQNAQKVSYINQWEIGGHYRFEGLGVRPVSDSKDEPTIDVSPTILQFGKVAVGTSATKTVTVTNTGSGTLTFHLVGSDDGFSFTPTEEVSLTSGQSSDVSISFSPQGVSQVGSVLRVFSNASNGTQFIECEGEGVESLVPIPELVDMGLSVLWASFNLGADSPSGRGKYYAWGETKAYGEEYPENTYNYEFTGSYIKTRYFPETYIFGPNLSKYVESDDHRTQLEPQDDAAYVLLGEGWHIPTQAQWEELINNATWEQVSGGYLVTSTVPGYTGASILLPYTGNRYENSLLNGGYGEYWSSTLSYREFAVGLSSSLQYSYYSLRREYRWDGLTIRPVHDKTSEPSASVPEAIDLGLPSGLKWASFNLGASKPEEFGDYYAWGETEPYYWSLEPLTWKEDKESGYDLSSYQWCMGTFYSMTKYCANSEYGYNGFSDNKTFLDKEDDAASTRLGGKWRIPTPEEQLELLEDCSWKEITVNGVRGYNVTGPNGNSIFLPYGACLIGTELRDVGSYCNYWSSSYKTNVANYNACSISLKTWERDIVNTPRYYGLPIRPVYDDSSTNKPDPVDLGLSVKWASCNLGATKPEEFGDFYAWGETEPYYISESNTYYNARTWKAGKEDGYSWYSYKWCKGSGSLLTKYCLDANSGYNGFIDGKTVLDSEDDAAYVNLGGNWRLPTKAEQDELREKCNWEWTSINGIDGYQVTGTNGNSIFLPAAGLYSYQQLVLGYTDGAYWTSSLDTDYSNDSAFFSFSSKRVECGRYDRCNGLPIRPVWGIP